jgi:hypothetical protein
MAKAKLHYPIKSGSSVSSRNVTFGLESRRSLEDLSSQIHSSLSKYVFPKLCRSCKLMCQRRLHPTTARLPPYLNDNKQNDISVWDSLCSKCRVAVSELSKSKPSNNRITSKTPLPNTSPNTQSSRINKKTQNAKSGFSSIPIGATGLLAQKFKDLVSMVCAYGSALSSPIRSSSPLQSTNLDPSSSFASSLNTQPISDSKVDNRAMFDEGSVYHKLIRAKREWCHFCGTSAASKWYPGPWGPKTLCYKHSGQCKGIDRLDLSGFQHENHRKEPVVRDSCGKCWSRLDVRTSSLRCSGCPFAYHVGCVPLSSKTINSRWFCSPQCIHSYQSCSVNVNLPFNAIAPFIEVELISGPDELSTPPRKRKHISISDDEAENDPNMENKIPRLASNIKESPIHSSPRKDIEIPVPGVVRHLLCASKRYSNSQLSLLSGKRKLFEERLDDCFFLDRHKRYEATEVSSRICRPTVLKKLLTPKKEIK